MTLAGQSDWRLPNIRELQTIVDRSVFWPAIDSGVFPNTPDSDFWSATAHAHVSYDAWRVLFHYGEASSSSKVNSHRVRLVRAGQLSGLLKIDRPNSDYVDQGNGTVMHTPTGLIWQQCEVGQRWTRSTCSGTASTHTWDSAKLLTSTFAGQRDWRLPKQDELFSLVDFSRANPAMNSALFPNATTSFVWSASAYANVPGYAWVIDFNNGNASYSGYRSGSYQVRLVRAGQSFGPVILTVSKSGTGQISSNVMPGIECGTLCGGGYNLVDVVTLNAIPVANFLSWGGACAGTTTTCTVTMDTAKTVTASFIDKPVVSILPAGLTFTAQNIGSTSAAQSVTLTNSGTEALTINSIAATRDFGVTHNCGSGLGAGGFCTLNITFSPTVSGTRTGSITINSNAPGTPHTIALSGTGQGSTSVANPTSLVFDSQGVGTTSAATTVTLSNTGGAVLNIASIVANGDFSRTTTCGSTLAQSASCTISVAFAPTTVGAQVSSLVITSDATTSPNTVSLQGTGAAVALVSLSPSSLSFAPQVVNTTSSARVVSLTNTGGVALTLTSISASGDFSVNNNCGGGLTAGGSCSLSVTFTPTAGGNRTGAVTVNSNATGSPHSVGLSGSSPSFSRLINLSTRGQVQTGDNVMIGGFIIGGSTPKKVLIRAVGPNLANYGVSGVLLDPSLQLFSGQTPIASIDDWGSASNAAEIQASGFAPVNGKESAILSTLNPGAYTAIVSGVGGGTGVGIVEVYELNRTEIPLINISTRGKVLTGDNVMIGGFIIQGDSAKTVLIRAVGPNLSNYGVTGVLANPKLQLYSGQTVIATNDDWGKSKNASAITATGLAPVNPLESAILITLQPGAYTAIVSGADGGSGVGIVEVFAQ